MRAGIEQLSKQTWMVRNSFFSVVAREVGYNDLCGSGFEVKVPI